MHSATVHCKLDKPGNQAVRPGTTIDVSSFIPGTGFYKVTVEIKAGHYRPWDLVYLAVERSNSKYVPIALQLIVSFEWNPDTSYLNDFIAGLREFVDHAWDAYEQQVIVTRIDVYVGGVMWNQANIRAHLLNDFNPNALVSYVLDGQGNPVPGTYRGLQLINLPKHWPHYSTTWNHWIAYSAITHELSHAYFHVADEYKTWNGAPWSAACGGFWDTYSIMDGSTHILYPRTEFCVRLNHDPDRDTAQSTWWWGWSCWETITYFNSEMYEPFGVHDTLIDNVAANYVQIVCH